MRDSYTRYPRAILWLVRGGECSIGGLDDDSRPAFSTRVGSFYISKLPVTNLQYEACRPDFRRAPASPADDDPAVGVSYTDALEYCRWYADVSRKAIRLPTEVEWEYACRGGTATRYFCGDDPVLGEGYVWDAGNSGGRVPSLRLASTNPFGLHALIGGVWEWTGSLHLPYPATDGDGRDDPDAPGPRVLRGGSFRTPREHLGCALRRAADPETRMDDVGFRIARSLQRSSRGPSNAVT